MYMKQTHDEWQYCIRTSFVFARKTNKFQFVQNTVHIYKGLVGELYANG